LEQQLVKANGHLDLLMKSSSAPQAGVIAFEDSQSEHRPLHRPLNALLPASRFEVNLNRQLMLA
jgi:hypothetical protein